MLHIMRGKACVFSSSWCKSKSPSLRGPIKKAVAIRVMFDLACAILPRMFCCCLLAFNPKWDEVLRGRPTLCCVSVGCRLYPFHV